MKYRTIFGIDSHARTTTICALVVETGETVKKTFRNNPYEEMKDWMRQFPHPSVGVYESGCTGFVPSRMLTHECSDVHPIASSKMPHDDDSAKQKNDRRDAERLARWELSGSLKAVWVPDEETEGLRDLCHAIEDRRKDRTAAYLRVQGLLCRHDKVWNQRTASGKLKSTWTRGYFAWLDTIELDSEGSQEALRSAIDAARSAKQRYDELVAKAREIAGRSKYAEVIEALCCLKCVQFVTALTFCAEVGDFSRFASGRKITSYVGLVPRESSSADKQSLGRMTKSGTNMLRKLLVECSWAVSRCRRNPKKKLDGVDEDVYERCVSLSNRLHDRRNDMCARKMKPNKANVASAAELARFMLEIGREVQDRQARRASASAATAAA